MDTVVTNNRSLSGQLVNRRTGEKVVWLVEEVPGVGGQVGGMEDLCVCGCYTVCLCDGHLCPCMSLMSIIRN